MPSTLSTQRQQLEKYLKSQRTLLATTLELLAQYKCPLQANSIHRRVNGSRCPFSHQDDCHRIFSKLICLGHLLGLQCRSVVATRMPTFSKCSNGLHVSADVFTALNLPEHFTQQDLSRRLQQMDRPTVPPQTPTRAMVPPPTPDPVIVPPPENAEVQPEPTHTCAICLEDINAREDLPPDGRFAILKRCRHTYCRDCLFTWALQEGLAGVSCPICRTISTRISFSASYPADPTTGQALFRRFRLTLEFNVTFTRA